MATQPTEGKKNQELWRKLQNKLRIQRQDLQRNYQYDLKQKLNEQSIEHEKNIKSLNEKLETELKTKTETYQQELEALRYVIFLYNH